MAKPVRVSDILMKIGEGRAALTDAYSVDTIRTELVYRIPEVRRWLRRQLSRIAASPSRREPSGSDWYVEREGDLIGPFAYVKLASLRARGSIKPNDIVFSLGSEQLLKGEEIAPAATVQLESRLFFDRRWPRKTVDRLASLSFEGSSVGVRVIDASERSIAIYSKKSLDSLSGASLGGQELDFHLQRRLGTGFVCIFDLKEKK